MSDQEIIFSEIHVKGGAMGQIILNRPKALNALTLDMCQETHQKLKLWATDQNIKAIIIKSADTRAFCAGGDVRKFYQNQTLPIEQLSEFFKHEYALDAAIFHFPKPYISFLNGITMGGGAGISIHGSFRVATERLVFAMPETAIGLFPDIGAGYFLTRCPGKTGWYYGLTGNKMDADTAYELGLINHLIENQNLDKLENDLLNAEYISNNNHDTVSAIISSYHTPTKPSLLLSERDKIDDCFSQNSIEKIIEKLQSYKTDDFCQATANTLLQRSPTSLKVTLEHLNRCAKMSFDEIIQEDWHLIKKFLATPDFYEGVRALLIDKDQAPKWQPSKLAEVTPEMVASYFSQKSSSPRSGT